MITGTRRIATRAASSSHLSVGKTVLEVSFVHRTVRGPHDALIYRPAQVCTHMGTMQNEYFACQSESRTQIKLSRHGTPRDNYGLDMASCATVSCHTTASVSITKRSRHRKAHGCLSQGNLRERVVAAGENFLRDGALRVLQRDTVGHQDGRHGTERVDVLHDGKRHGPKKHDAFSSPCREGYPRRSLPRTSGRREW